MCTYLIGKEKIIFEKITAFSNLDIFQELAIIGCQVCIIRTEQNRTLFD